ncbi:hypothetical protein AK88_04303 [Plasmodium fragile]|uniref:Schizont-infected cell agglutination C-terminal domain-containing protein n=1 Tax=Plasmodium fragile TaxID=5857 RepID=A0A0D9QJY0_PLAFR|nr:uncharacterized protein AK88_04303 [Plasmodium fragile]KJP86046.1 hypothetical protein AK88_04303 [Plasmodium fragile]
MEYVQKLFWTNVTGMWQKFKEHMEDARDDAMIELMCNTDHTKDAGGESEDTFSDKDKAVCWLALKALFFKHAIKLHVTTIATEHLGNTAAADGVMPYMKCILVNIFMKKIVGEKCLDTTGARQAFLAAQGLVREGKKAEPNMACEKADRKDGRRQKSQKTEDWNLGEIMTRWLQRNIGYLRDGEVGVLGQECTVQRDKTAEHIKQEANKKIEDLGKEIENTVKEILKEIDKSPEGTSMDDILKQLKDSTSPAPTDKDHVARPPPPPPPSGPSMPSSPDGRGREGAGESGTAQTVSKPAPANTQPVKPVHSTSAKPVAATPPDQGTKNTVTTTATSGGGGKPGDATPGGGKEKAPKAKTGTEDNCEWRSVMDKGHSGLHVMGRYSNEEWTRVKNVLDDFATHMQNYEKYMEQLGANCNNAYWEDFTKGIYEDGQRVADMVRCRLMSGALWFANTQGIDGKGRGNDAERESYERLRCEVANVFGHLLRTTYCPKQNTWKRGIEYAYTAMRNMGKNQDGTPVATELAGPVVERTCNICGYEGSRTKPGIINGDIAQLLVQQGIMGELTQIERQMPCAKDWKQYIRDSATKGDSIKDILTERGIQEVEKVKEDIKRKTKQVIETAQDKVQQEIAKAAAKPIATKTEALKPQAAKPAAVKPPPKSQPPEKTEEPPAAPAAPAGSPGRSDQAAEDTRVPAAGPVPQPPPAAPPGTGADGSGTPGQGPGQQPPPAPEPARPAAPAGETVDGKEETKDKTAEGKDLKIGSALDNDTKNPPGTGAVCPHESDNIDALTSCLDKMEQPKIHSVDDNDETDQYRGKGPVGIPGSTRVIDISKGTSPDISGAPPGAHYTTSVRENHTKGKEKSDGSSTPTELDPKSSVAAEPAAEVPTKPEVSKVTPGSEGATGVTSTEVSAQPQGKAAPEGGEGTPAASAPKTGSSDDTITPPKDSTSNDKTQGSEHPASAAGPDPGVAVIDGGNDDPPPLNPPKPKPNPNPDQAGSSGGEGKGGGDVGGTQLVTPSVRPGVTWEDIKPYTPEIIPAVVGIGIIAFFLWKYFAYLAKRRRKFRTVRDVPSPPLDEEILDHLQRGAPPPDYGYTIVRDRRPGTLPDRRRRQPRVNRRTIIELHLEVLNECEAAEWENVKDNYWQILVQEFMGDGNGHSGSPDTAIPNEGLPGNNVPSTESDGIDRCPPNAKDPDRWSCMDTIQLDEEQHSYPCPYSPGNEIPALDRTKWIPWIEHNKYLLRQCTGETWFLQLKAEWKQYQHQYAANEDNGQRALGAPGNIPYTERKKLDLWKEWVAQQHRQMSVHREEVGSNTYWRISRRQL